METFEIFVREKFYIVEEVEQGNELQFKISTDCKYLMTIYIDENGNWTSRKDVSVMYKTLVIEMGKAIELVTC